MQQTLLFEDVNPLPDLLGKDFFRSLPETPGVYLMKDRDEKVIYVGQSKNLKQRLYSYRVIKAETSPKRLVRLVNRIASIEIRECDSQADALRVENQLIRELNPTYNRAQVYPYKNPYWLISESELGLKVRLVRGKEPPVPDEGETLYGVFSAGSSVRILKAMSRMLTLCFDDIRRSESVSSFFFEDKVKGEVELPMWEIGAHHFKMSRRFLCYVEGRNRHLLWVLFRKLFFRYFSMDRLLRRQLRRDFMSTWRFFRMGPRLNHEINRSFDRHVLHPVSQDERSDWQIERKISNL